MFKLELKTQSNTLRTNVIDIKSLELLPTANDIVTKLIVNNQPIKTIALTDSIIIKTLIDLLEEISLDKLEGLLITLAARKTSFNTLLNKQYYANINTYLDSVRTAMDRITFVADDIDHSLGEYLDVDQLIDDMIDRPNIIMFTDGSIIILPNTKA